MGEFILKGTVGLGLLLIWVYLMVFIDWLNIKLKIKISEGLFVAVIWLSIFIVSWFACYGVGSAFFDVFFR